MSAGHTYLKKVAVTGGLSCGKSTVCNFFKELGAYVVNADQIVHRLLSPIHPIGKKVIALLGSEILMEGQIVRSKIAEKVFQQPELLSSLERILLPTVHDAIEDEYHRATLSSQPLFVAEVPLLFETHEERYYDVTIAVVAPSTLCLERFKKSTGYSEQQYNGRMARQLTPEMKGKKATYLIVNDGSFDEMQRKVASIYTEILSTPQMEPEF